MPIFEGKNKKIISKRNKQVSCKHDYKNATQIGTVDYQCPLCGKVLDPLEWFLMNSFEFVDVTVVDKIPERKS